MFTFTTTDSDLTATVFRCRGWHIAAGGVASNVLLRDGGASGTIFVSIKIPANTSVHFDSALPIPFPKGLYIDTDANVTNGTVVG